MPRVDLKERLLYRELQGRQVKVAIVFRNLYRKSFMLSMISIYHHNSKSEFAL